MASRHLRPLPAQDTPASTRPFGTRLVAAGLLEKKDLPNALRLQQRIDAPLGEILVSCGIIDRRDVLETLADQHHVTLVNLRSQPPALQMAGDLPLTLCLKHQVVPWMWTQGRLRIATARPDRFDAVAAALPVGLTAAPVLADVGAIQAEISRLYQDQLLERATSRVPTSESCRSWAQQRTRWWPWLAGCFVALAACCIVAPLWAITFLCLCAFATLILTTALKFAAFVAQISKSAEAPAPQDPAPPFRLPFVSVMIPLFHETEIAGALVKRLTQLSYPKSQLEILLVLEAQDQVTRATLARTELPPWARIIEVPDDNGITTKPRALNYALDFCRGSIVGVWDAEDAPETDQIEKVVRHFAKAPREVACLQGVLDYYNPKTNWLSRCFTIEYAIWWRLILPGIARMGLVIPLGGTTLFFRKEILEKLGAWDAHNVTEDADLGVRLARHGYRTELIDTVTFEEANCRPWRWIRQRSRWLKGFMINYLVHMQSPRDLLRELGWKRVLGLQIVFLATVIQFAAAPFLWSFWIVPFGLTHPVETTLGTPFLWVMVASFLIAELIGLTLGAVAVAGRSHRHLWPWVITMPLYFPLGAFAAYKALYELGTRPFFWDKTEHGFAPAPAED